VPKFYGDMVAASTYELCPKMKPKKELAYKE